MKFKKKKVTIDALQWNGLNKKEFESLINTKALIVFDPEPNLVVGPGRKDRLKLHDWLILDTGGSYYICEDKHFRDSYEEMD